VEDIDMHPFLQKTIGGLAPACYVRHLLFGMLFPAFVLTMLSTGDGERPVTLGTWGFMIVSTLLYPYARFVYESVVDYVVGNNAFIVDGMLALGIKVVTMAWCWVFALVIAPIGLAYLYFRHSRS
jgi:hypothetical protein